MWFVTLDCEVMNLFTGKGESGGVRVTAAQRAQSLLHTAGRWGPSWQTDCNYPAHTHLYTLTHLQQLHTIVALRGEEERCCENDKKRSWQLRSAECRGECLQRCTSGPALVKCARCQALEAHVRWQSSKRSALSATSDVIFYMNVWVLLMRNIPLTDCRHASGIVLCLLTPWLLVQDLVTNMWRIDSIY